MRFARGLKTSDVFYNAVVCRKSVGEFIVGNVGGKFFNDDLKEAVYANCWVFVSLVLFFVLLILIASLALLFGYTDRRPRPKICPL